NVPHVSLNLEMERFQDSPIIRDKSYDGKIIRSSTDATRISSFFHFFSAAILLVLLPQSLR
ncbi:MAG: hypothetical protein WBF33_03145, partial [Candidatus Nitrosopolaris sp.]